MQNNTYKNTFTLDIIKITVYNTLNLFLQRSFKSDKAIRAY